MIILSTLFFLSNLYAYPIHKNDFNLANQIDIVRYQNNLKKIAISRLPGSSNHTFIREYLIQTLKGLSYDVKEDKYETGINVVARKIGTRLPNEEIIISAHYDSYNASSSLQECYGADDNASGVSAVLEMARVLAHLPVDRTLTLIFWDEEENQMLGSRSYASRYIQDGLKTKMMFSLDTIGYADHHANTQTLPLGYQFAFPEQYNQIINHQSRADFISVSTDDSKESQLSVRFMEEAAQKENLPIIVNTITSAQKNDILFENFLRSDHASFWAYSIPAMMISDTANFRNENYHCKLNKQDSIDTIDYDFALKVTKIITYAAVSLLQLQE